MNYYGIATPGMIGALVGSLANSAYKGHDAKTFLIRGLENVFVIGFPVAYMAAMASVEGTYPYYALVSVGVFILWNNPWTRPLVDQIDTMRASLLNLIV
jgi:hypothetical protein